MNIILLFIINEAITKFSWDYVYLNLTLDYNQESKDIEQSAWKGKFIERNSQMKL